MREILKTKQSQLLILLHGVRKHHQKQQQQQLQWIPIKCFILKVNWSLYKFEAIEHKDQNHLVVSGQSMIANQSDRNFIKQREMLDVL